jgi:hypothetical protein
MEIFLAGNLRREDVELRLLKFNRLYSYFYSTGKQNSHDLENRIKAMKKSKRGKK